MPDWPPALDIGLIVSALAAVVAVVRKVWPLMRRINHFIDDWFGEGERPGVKATPGVVARLAAIEEHGTKVDSRLDQIEAQFRPNGGSTLRDALDRVENAVVAEPPTDQHGR
jgi:hypothetical protein